MSASKTPVTKDEAPVKIAAHFIGKIERREIPEWDPAGIETLAFLIEALKAIDTKTSTWDSLARYVLEKANDKFRYTLYTSTLRALSAFASPEITEAMVKHFISFGEVDAVIDIAINKLHRFISHDDVAPMVKWHRTKETATTSMVWKKLFAIADEIDRIEIEKALAELEIIENDFVIT